MQQGRPAVEGDATQLRQVVRDRPVRPGDATDGDVDDDVRSRIHRSLLAGLLSHVGMREVAFGGGAPGVRRRSPVEYLGARGTRFAIFPGSERFLLQGLAAGAPGCISATANYDVGLIRKVLETPDGPERERLARRMLAIRTAFEKHPVIPALKYVQARRSGDPLCCGVPEPRRRPTQTSIAGADVRSGPRAEHTEG